MRKYTIVSAVIGVIIGIFLLFGGKYGLQLGSINIAPSNERKLLEDMTRKFWEDVQFKDFEAAASYHEADLKTKYDIPYLIERLFFVKPEYLDIRTIEIQEVHIDSTRDRGRARTRLIVNVLNAKSTEEPQIVLYWYKKNDQWYLRLESSLRLLEDRTKKQHGRV